MLGKQRRRIAAVVLGALLVATVASVGAGGQSSVVAQPVTADEGTSNALVARQLAPAADNTITRILVTENGSATWQLRIRTRLETDGAAADYRAFQAEFRANRSEYVDAFRESITGIVANARAVTGREMRAEGFGASTSVQTVPRRWGVVTYEFRWVGFGATEGERIIVGDIFEGGLFIAADDALEITAPDGYRVQSVEPQPDEAADGAVSWQGREDFADRRPRVVLVPAGGGSPEPLSWPAVLGGVSLVGLLVLAALGYRRVRWGQDGNGGAEMGSDDGPVGGDPEPVLADEDQVERLLTEHGGRMRQQAIAESLDWSRSKTSRVLGRMAEEGQVRKLQLGRENVIALPDGE